MLGYISSRGYICRLNTGAAFFIRLNGIERLFKEY